MKSEKKKKAALRVNILLPTDEQSPDMNKDMQHRKDSRTVSECYFTGKQLFSQSNEAGSKE